MLQTAPAPGLLTPVEAPGITASKSHLSLWKPSRNVPSSDFPKLQVGIDFLNFAGDLTDPSAIASSIEALEEIFEDKFEIKLGRPLRRGKQYSHTAMSVKGIVLAWSEPKDSKYSLWLSIPGKPCRTLTVEQFRILGEVLECLPGSEGRIHCTRIDFALDCFDKTIFSYAKLKKANRAYNFTGFKTAAEEVVAMEHEGEFGWKFHWGKGGEKQVVIYNKRVESKGEIDAIRLETRYSYKRAAMIWEDFMSYNLTSLQDDYPEKMAHIAVGAIQFINREKETKNLDRVPLLPWWRKFMGLAGGVIKIRVPRKEYTLKKACDWLERQAAPILAVLQKSFGYEGFETFIKYLLENGKRRFRQQHINIIEVAYKEAFYGYAGRYRIAET